MSAVFGDQLPQRPWIGAEFSPADQLRASIGIPDVMRLHASDDRGTQAARGPERIALIRRGAAWQGIGGFGSRGTRPHRTPTRWAAARSIQVATEAPGSFGSRQRTPFRGE